MKIKRSVLDTLGFDLDDEIHKFRNAIMAHRTTINVPAPTAHPLVEAIVRENDGIEIIDDDIEMVSAASLDRLAALEQLVLDRCAQLQATVEARLENIDKAMSIILNQNNMVRDQLAEARNELRGASSKLDEARGKVGKP